MVTSKERYTIYYLYSLEPVYFLEAGISRDIGYYNPEYHTMINARTKAVLQILRLGYSVLLSDVDSVWLRNPFPYLDTKNYDIIGQNDRSDEETTLCGGFLLLNPTPATIDLWTEVTFR